MYRGRLLRWWLVELFFSSSSDIVWDRKDGTNMMTETVWLAFELLLQGMVGIFVVIGAIAGLVVGMQKFEAGWKNHQSQSETTSSTVVGPTK